MTANIREKDDMIRYAYFIMITRPCNLYPLAPPIYKVKLKFLRLSSPEPLLIDKYQFSLGLANLTMILNEKR